MIHSRIPGTNLITMVEFWTRTRFIVLVLLLLCMTFVWYVSVFSVTSIDDKPELIFSSNILSFNFAVICMAPDPNATAPQEDRYTFTESKCTYIINHPHSASQRSNTALKITKLVILTIRAIKNVNQEYSSRGHFYHCNRCYSITRRQYPSYFHDQSDWNTVNAI